MEVMFWFGVGVFIGLIIVGAIKITDGKRP